MVDQTFWEDQIHTVNIIRAMLAGTPSHVCMIFTKEHVGLLPKLDLEEFLYYLYVYKVIIGDLYLRYFMKLKADILKPPFSLSIQAIC
jgi:hypothetical protein